MVDVHEVAAKDHWFDIPLANREFVIGARFNLDAKMTMHLLAHEAIPPGSLAAYGSLATLTLMILMNTPIQGQGQHIDIDHLGHIMEGALPPAISRVNIDLTPFTSLELSMYLFDSKQDTTRLQWEKLDQVLIVARDLHPRLRDIGILLPRASQKHTDRWTVAIEAYLSKSMACSLCHVVPNVGESTHPQHMILESNGEVYRCRQNTLHLAGHMRLSINMRARSRLLLILQAGS